MLLPLWIYYYDVVERIPFTNTYQFSTSEITIFLQSHYGIERQKARAVAKILYNWVFSGYIPVRK